MKTAYVKGNKYGSDYGSSPTNNKSKNTNNYNVGIYCRLSREDLRNGRSDISLSIINQQSMLADYADERGWNIYKTYSDDDVTGTTFNRPEFQVMMGDIESGYVNLVITTDLSRLGRNYIEAGRHRELFSEYGVRYIAIHDNHDSEKDDYNDISTPIKEIMNEMYAANISRKVRSTKKLMANQGKFANSRAPYGYLKSPENKHMLIIDEDVSHNVERIFELYLGGKTARAIADIFNGENIPTTNDYFYNKIGKPNPYLNHKNKWGSASVTGIIKNPAYYGAIANGKRELKSFKNKTAVIKPIEEWIIVENTHEPIISKEKWLEAQKLGRNNKRDTVRRSANGEVSLFAGIVKCAACGNNLVFNKRTLKSGLVKEFFVCSTYAQKGKDVCSMRNIDFNTVYTAVLASVQEYAVLADEDEYKLIGQILKSNDSYQTKNTARHEKAIRQSKNRVKEIDTILQNLYEDKISGEITSELFKRMSGKFGEEQTHLIQEIEKLQIELEEANNTNNDLSGWIARIKKCLEINTLTRAIAVELIDRIEVSEIYSIEDATNCTKDGIINDSKSGTKNLDISISFKFGLQPQKSSIAKPKSQSTKTIEPAKTPITGTPTSSIK
jgi:DNA invertase Pin-like site-specific DNA recombinase